jgi:hypothetical protein
MSLIAGKDDINIASFKLKSSDSLHLDIDKLKDPTGFGTSSIDTGLDFDDIVDSDSEAHLSDGSLPSSNSEDESDGNQSDDLLDSDEIRSKLHNLQSGQGGTHVRRSSIPTVIPNWPSRDEEAFKRGKEVRTLRCLLLPFLACIVPYENIIYPSLAGLNGVAGSAFA